MLRPRRSHLLRCPSWAAGSPSGGGGWRWPRWEWRGSRDAARRRPANPRPPPALRPPLPRPRRRRSPWWPPGMCSSTRTVTWSPGPRPPAGRTASATTSAACSPRWHRSSVMRTWRSAIWRPRWPHPAARSLAIPASTCSRRSPPRWPPPATTTAPPRPTTRWTPALPGWSAPWTPWMPPASTTPAPTAAQPRPRPRTSAPFTASRSPTWPSYGLNGIPELADKPWAVDDFDPAGPQVAGMLAEAHAARAAGAQIVIASVHCCTEYTTDPTAAQVAIASALLASPDVDLVVGHHAHVVQPVERIGGKWVAYGLGNYIAEQTPQATRDSVIARFTFIRGPDGSYTVRTAEAIPTAIQPAGDGLAVVPTHPGDPSYQRVADVVDRRGAADAGLLIIPG